MATVEQETQKREDLGKVLAVIAKIKPEGLVREDLGRELNFSAGLPYFQRILRLFRDLAESNLDSLPYERLNQLHSIAKAALDQFNKIQTFSVQQHPQNPAQDRDTLINQIRDSFDPYFNHISPVIAYSVRKGTDFERLENEARQTLEQLESIVTEQEKSRIAMMGEIEGTLEKIRRAAQEVGVAQHAVHFKNEAKDHNDAARWWLAATVGLAAVTILFGGASLIYFVEIFQSLTTSQTIQLAIAKLIIFSVLFSGVLWNGRIYRAHRHNFVINKHRQNALSTFETFVKAAGDEQTKSAVLLQATQCIFSPQHSGYISKESESTNYPQVLEIIRGIAGSQK